MYIFLLNGKKYIFVVTIQINQFIEICWTVLFQHIMFYFWNVVIFQFFASFCNGQISQQQHKGQVHTEIMQYKHK